MEYYDEQKLEKELLEIHDFSQIDHAFLHPWLLLKNSRKISFLKDQLEKVKQRIEEGGLNDRDGKIVIENLERDIRFLQSKLDIIDHNFIFFSAITSLTSGAISIIVTVFPSIWKFIWECKK